MTSPRANSLDISPEMAAEAVESKAWPFEEARKIVKRYEGRDWPAEILFETGYGPSGLPHIGTFGEVARTTMGEYFYAGTAENLQQVYESLSSRLTVEKKETEISGLLALVASLLVMLSAGLSMLWFNRLA